MNSVGIDISKGKSKTAVMRPFGDVVVSPFEVRHTYSELGKLVKLLKSLDGETCVVKNLRVITLRRWPGCSTAQGFMFPWSMQCWFMTTETIV